jgi:ribosome maturation protein Sdo1
VTSIRNQVVTIIAWMKERGANYDSIVNQNTKDAYSRGEDYDVQELILLMGILLLRLSRTRARFEMKISPQTV